jgi:hypothetical protein
VQRPRAVLGSSTGRKWAVADWAVSGNHLVVCARFFGWVKSWFEVLGRKEKGSVAKDGEMCLWAWFQVEKGAWKHCRV